jgi:hypothetical protein
MSQSEHTARTIRGSSQALTVVRSMISTLGKTAVSSGMVGSGLSGVNLPTETCAGSYGLRGIE